MAEIVGLVASGISIATLAVQIANSLAKLKSYWNDIIEAPEDITLLIEELDGLYHSLADIDKHQHRNPISSTVSKVTSISRCLELCRQAASQLEELTDKLSADINTQHRLKKRWASAKVVFKKDKIKKYKSRLKSAIRLLSISYQCYTTEMLQMQPDIIVSRLLQSINTVQTQDLVLGPTKGARHIVPPCAATCQSITSLSASNSSGSGSSSFGNGARLQRRRNEQRKMRTFHYRKVLYFMNWAWDVEVCKSRSGWNNNLRTYNIIPSGSSVIRLAREGDVRGLLDLFAGGQASPFDVDEGGRSLLSHAAWSHHLPVCRLLLEQGVDPEMTSKEWPNALLFDVMCNSVIQRLDLDEFLGTVHLLLNSCGIELETQMLRSFRGPKEGFLSLVQHTDVPYYETSIEIRGHVAIDIAKRAPFNSPELFRVALHPGPISSADVAFESDDGETLLHAVAQALASSMQPRSLKNKVRSQRECGEDLEGWRLLTRELVTIGADIHAVSIARRWPTNGVPQTPFISLFEGLDWLNWNGSTPQKFQLVATIWLEDLVASGVDLVEYGRKERETWDLSSISKDVPFFFDWGLDSDPEIWHIVNFDFGAAPSDWHIWWSEPTDVLAGEFWAMIENPEETMPGSWIE